MIPDRMAACCLPFQDTLRQWEEKCCHESRGPSLDLLRQFPTGMPGEETGKKRREYTGRPMTSLISSMTFFTSFRNSTTTDLVKSFTHVNSLTTTHVATLGESKSLPLCTRVLNFCTSADITMCRCVMCVACGAAVVVCVYAEEGGREGGGGKNILNRNRNLENSFLNENRNL